LTKKNSYESVDVTVDGGVNFGSDIHGEALRINRLIWDIVDFLDKKNLYGFHIKPVITKNKITIILFHTDKNLLKKGKNLLKNFIDLSDIILIARLKREDNRKRRWILYMVVALILASALLFFIGNLIFKHYSLLFESQRVQKEDSNGTVEVKIDIKKLKALQESIKSQNNKLDPRVLKSMDITTAVISDAIPPSQKEKYKAENLVKRFKGKGGIKLVLVNRDLNSSEFNRSVKELKEYANEFIKRGDIEGAIRSYNGILKKAKSEDEKIETLSKRANLYREVGEDSKAVTDYNRALKRIDKLEKRDSKKYSNAKAFILGKRAKIDKGRSRDRLLKDAEDRYITELEKNIKLYRRSPKKHIQDLAWNYNLVANFYLNDKVDLNKSIRYRKKAIGLYKKLLKIDSSKFKISLYKTYNSLAKSYLKLNRFNLALKYYKLGFELIKDSRDREYIAISYQNLGYLYSLKRDYKRAKDRLNLALKNFKDINSSRALDIEFNLAKIELIEGNLKVAKEHFIKLKEQYLKIKFPKYNYNIAKIDINLAWIDIQQKQITESQKLLDSTLNMAKEIKKGSIEQYREILSTIYSYQAHIYTVQNRFDIAIGYYKKSLNIQREFETNLRYANLLFISKRYLDSFREFEDMLNRYKSREERAKTLMSYGKLYLSFDSNEAKKILKEALNIYISLKRDNGINYKEIEEIEKMVI